MDDKGRTRGRVAGRLMIEALVSGGPRKSPEEVKANPELCEDAAGYLALDDHCFFWVCDGTSESNALPGRAQESPGFNSRILASDLGHGFGSLALEALLKGEDPKPILPKRLFEDIAGEWRVRLIEYLSWIESEGKLPVLLSRLPKTRDGSYRLKWSSTILGGIYNERAQTLDVLNIGDCSAVVLGERVENVAPRATCGIIVANMRQDPLEVTVTPIEVEYAWEHFEGVTSFIAVSDGVAKDLSATLSEMQESTAEMPLYDVRKRLITGGAMTYDDRAVVIGRFLEKCRGEGESHAHGWLANALLSVRRAFS